MDRVTAPARVFRSAEGPLGPYVPTLVADWLRDRPQERHRAIDCTLVFADIAGFTRMTELLGARGRIGAEEMADLINLAFGSLLTTAYAYGAGLIKWGGDATLLLFDGDDHVARGCRAAYEMQRVMRASGRLTTSRGPLRLRMSIGAHSGRCDFFLVGHDDHRELIVAGRPATLLAELEKAAGPGQIVVSDGTAAQLARAGRAAPLPPAGPGHLLRRAPTVLPRPPGAEVVDYHGVSISAALCEILREHILGGGVESEHRQATVGFIGISGVDALLERAGPQAAGEAIDEAIRAVQDAAAAEEVAFLATDIAADGATVMLSAGAPRRIGHDERRMVAALRTAIDAAGGLTMRAGATSGRAFAGDFGPSYRRTYSLMGDCVNLAARLCELAGDGEILVDGELADAVRGSFTAMARPPLTVKGRRAAVTAWRITPRTASLAGPGDTAGDDSPAPLIGRDAELATLLAQAQAASEGRGTVVEIVGEPGIGKTSLLTELRDRVGEDVLWVDGDVYAGARPYDPFQRLVRERWGPEIDTPQDSLADRLQSAVARAAPQLTPWLSLIGIAAGVDLEVSTEVRQTDASVRKQRLEEATSELLGVLLPGATTFIFNDVELMDDASRDLIARLAADAPARRWLVIVSRRPDGASPLAQAPGVRMELGPLSAAAVARLLERATDAAPMAPHRLAELTRRSEGNPLFLRALVAQLREGGDPTALPRSVEAAIAARIDRLPTADRRILRSAAVLGMDIDVALLAEVLGDEWREPGGDDRPDRLGPLAEFLEPAGPQRYRFAHQLVREVAYEGLPYRRRTVLHGATAAAIERAAAPRADEQAELLSLHCFHGGRYESAWRYARLAARTARDHYANAEAAESYRLALAAAGHFTGLTASELAEVDTALGEVCVELGELRAADVAWRRALGRVRHQPTDAARLQLELARLRDMSGHHRAALSWTARAEATVDGMDGPEVRLIRAQLAVRRARNSYRRGRHADALAFSGRAIKLARRDNNRRTLAEALEYADLCSVELGLTAGEGAEQALAIYEELGDLGAQARVRNTLGMLAYHRGAWPEAIDHYAAAERTYQRCGRPGEAATAAANRAEILADQGRLDEARVALDVAMPIWRSVEASAEIAFGEYELGRIAGRQGATGEAMRRFDAARDYFRAVGELTEVIVVDALAAEARWLSGDPAAALALADDALARARALGGVAAATPLLQRVRGATLLALGRHAEAERALRSGLDAARERDAGHEVAFTLTALINGGMAADPAEEADWRTELAGLRSGLDIVAGPLADARIG